MNTNLDFWSNDYMHSSISNDYLFQINRVLYENWVQLICFMVTLFGTQEKDEVQAACYVQWLEDEKAGFNHIIYFSLIAVLKNRFAIIYDIALFIYIQYGDCFPHIRKSSWPHYSVYGRFFWVCVILFPIIWTKYVGKQNILGMYLLTLSHQI